MRCRKRRVLLLDILDKLQWADEALRPVETPEVLVAVDLLPTSEAVQAPVDRSRQEYSPLSEHLVTIGALS